MPYCTQADYEAAYGRDELLQLTDRAGLGVIDATVLVEAIEAADSIIDGYCRARYSVPLSPVDAVVASLSLALTRHRLYGHRVTQEVQVARDDAVATLKDISAGRMHLSAAAATNSGATTGLPEFETSDQLFSRPRMRGE